MNALNPPQKSSLCASGIASVVARDALPIEANLSPTVRDGLLIQCFNSREYLTRVAVEPEFGGGEGGNERR
jgi:hypothetical protein